MTKLDALRYLENLQEHAYSHFGKLQKEISEEEVLKTKNEIFEEIFDKMSPFISPEKLAALKEKTGKEIFYEIELPTRFENPSSYRIILDLRKEIEEASKDLSISIPIELVVGTLPTGQVNARVIKIPSNGDFVVVFESGFFTFANLLAKATIKAMPFIGTENDKLSFSTDWDGSVNSDALRRFQEVIIAYLLHGQPNAAPPYLIDYPHQRLTNILRNSMELFVIGHEYGHVIGGHFSTGQKTSAFLIGNEVNEIIYSWQQEFEADAWGLQLMLHAMMKKGHDLSLSFWGADFFFSCIDVVERSTSIIRTGELKNQPLGSHPPAKARREALRKVLKRSLSEDQTKGPIDLGMKLERIMEELFNRTRPILRRCYDNKQKLSPIWYR